MKENVSDKKYRWQQDYSLYVSLELPHSILSNVKVFARSSYGMDHEATVKDVPMLQPAL